MLHRFLLVSSFQFFVMEISYRIVVLLSNVCICYVMLGSTFREGKIDSRAVELIYMFGCFRVELILLAST